MAYESSLHLFIFEYFWQTDYDVKSPTIENYKPLATCLFSQQNIHQIIFLLVFFLIDKKWVIVTVKNVVGFFGQLYFD